jgi:hypothetical protein
MKLTAAQAIFKSLDIPGSPLTQFLTIPEQAIVQKMRGMQIGSVFIHYVQACAAGGSKGLARATC